MSESESVLIAMIKRRVPQIVGLYIAATWMMIEIGDWISERFQLPLELTSYIFIGMSTFLPSVIYLAFVYGAKGKDPWKPSTLVVVPLNLFICVFSMLYFVQPVDTTEKKTVVDEDGKAQVFEVAKSEFRKNIFHFFWEQKGESDEIQWLEYGIPWMLSSDLTRSVYIFSRTPFTSDSVVEKLAKSGFKNGLNVPLGLRLSIAREKRAQFLLTGEYEFRDDQYRLTSRLFDVKSGEKISTSEVKGGELLPLIDQMSKEITEQLSIPLDQEGLSDALPIEEHLSSNLQAIKNVVEALLKDSFENDLPSSIQLLEKAIDLDPKFARALFLLSNRYQLMGRTQDALRLVQQVKNHSYKFTADEQFKLKTMSYALKGDYEKQLKIVDMWLEVYPESTDALFTMATMQLLTGLDLDKAEKSLIALRRLLPDNDGVIQHITQMHILKGNLEQAEVSQKLLIDKRPEQVSHWIKLAEIQMRQTKFNEAETSLDRVLLLEPDNPTAQQQLAMLYHMTGRVDESLILYDQLLSSDLSAEQLLQAFNSRLRLLTNQGQYRRAIDSYGTISQKLHELPLINKIFFFDYPRAFLYLSVGEFEKAHETFENGRASLQPPLSDVMDIGLISSYYFEKNLEQFDVVYERLKRHIKSNPNPMMSHGIYLSEMYRNELLGDYDSALQAANNLLSEMTKSVVNAIDSTGIIAQQVEVARLELLSGNAEQALETINDCLKRFPSSGKGMLIKAKVLLALEEKESALRVIERLEQLWVNADPDYIDFQDFQEVKREAQLM